MKSFRDNWSDWKRFYQLESLDLLNELDPLLTQTTNDEVSVTNLDEDKREAFTNPYPEYHEESYNDDIYLTENDNRNIFHIFVDATEAKEDWFS